MNDRINNADDDTLNGRKKVSVAKTAALTVLVLLLIAAAAYAAADISGNATDNTLNSKGIFYPVLPDSVVNIQPFSDGLVILTDTSVEYADISGNEMSVNSHTYANPAMYVNGKNVILFDRGGYSFRIEKSGTLYNDFTLTSVITGAAIGKKGNYAYCLNADGGYQSHLYVYSYNGKKQFEWGSASDYIMDIALSDNGKYCAVALVGVENAEYYSRVILFAFNSEEPVYSTTLPGVTVYELGFISGKKTAAFTDSGILSFNNNGEHTEVKAYYSSEMCHSATFTGGLKCISLSKYANDKLPVVTVFDKKYRQLFENSYTEAVNAVECSTSYIATVFDDRIEILNSKNTLVGNIELTEACLDITMSGRRIYVLTAGGLYSYSVNTVTDNNSSIDE